jgi:hypothetical protein
MSALFPRWTNTVSRLMAGVLLATPAVAIAALLVWVRTPFVTGQFTPVEQPVQFDHRHHVGDEGIDCRYCHATVESSPYAGVPGTAVCMNCHSQVWNKSPLLAYVREQYFTDRPIPWTRVHNLPDYVYFNHSIHVNKGVGCATCHGRVDTMAAVQQVAPLSMAWCLECHRDPSKYLRPLEEITSMSWEPTSPDEGRALAERYDVHARVSCTTCHR